MDIRPSMVLAGSSSIASGLRDTSNGPVARLTIRTSKRGESRMLTLRTRATGGNSWSGSWQKEVPASRGDAFPSHASNVRVVRVSDWSADAVEEFPALRDARAIGFSGRRNTDRLFFMRHRFEYCSLSSP